MKKFIVQKIVPASIVSYHEVEANSMEEAIDISKGMVGEETIHPVKTDTTYDVTERE